ncbi:homoserine dehydrogenase [Cutibacterium acnes JCM 18916]|nr:homoserine dehydrogenase [Cutibacterium acnes JCM 18916]
MLSPILIARARALTRVFFTDDPTVLVNRDDVDIVIELIGGIDLPVSS